jgi:hypothetical protein
MVNAECTRERGADQTLAGSATPSTYRSLFTTSAHDLDAWSNVVARFAHREWDGLTAVHGARGPAADAVASA